MENQQVRFKRHPDIPVYISENGDVKNLKGRTLKTFINWAGYLGCSVMLNGKTYTFQVHREVARLFLPPPSKELIEKCSKEHWGKVLVMHKDNNRFNNHYTNLMWGSLGDNTRQAFRDGLVNSAKGERNGSAKLSEEVVRKICERFQEGATRKDIMKEFGVSRHQAYSIRNRLSWVHISSEYNF